MKFTPVPVSCHWRGEELGRDEGKGRLVYLPALWHEMSVPNTSAARTSGAGTVSLIWGLFDRAPSSWNNVKYQLDTIGWFYWCILSSTCFGYIGRARARHHPHRTHELRSGCQDHQPSKISVQKTICCNSTSNAPDDGGTYLKHVELRIH